MRHLKNIDTFFGLNEQLFGNAATKIAKELFGSKKGSTATTYSGTSPQPSISNGETKGEVKIQKTDRPPDSAKDLGSYGKFTQGANPNSPLVVVYGGTDVGGRKSGVYMYDYFGGFENRYNLFVAKDPNINGLEAYKAIKNKVGSAPSKKILYLFSGGYRPGKKLLEQVGAGEFDKIYLVDIWMGNQPVGDFYSKLAEGNGKKIEYYYTSFGGNNSSATNRIASASSVKIKQKENSHMKTNEDAVKSLATYA